MKKILIVLFLAFAMATPAHAQLSSTSTPVFPPEQQELINQIIALIQELQRQLQIQITIEYERQLALDAELARPKYSEFCKNLALQIDTYPIRMQEIHADYAEKAEYIKTNPGGTSKAGIDFLLKRNSESMSAELAPVIEEMREKEAEYDLKCY